MRHGRTHTNTPARCIQLLLAYVFREVRDTVPFKRFFLKMIDRDFKALRKSSQIGKIIQRITVRTLRLGTAPPHIKTV